MADTLQATFNDQYHAQRAISALRRGGIRAGDIYVVNVRQRESPEAQSETTTHRLKVRSPGNFMINYAVTGAIAGALLGIFAMTWIPSMHHVARHHLMAALLGGVLGCMFATICGALSHVDELRADSDEIDGHLANGSIVVCVDPQAPEVLPKAEKILRGEGGRDISYECPLEGMTRIPTHQIE